MQTTVCTPSAAGLQAVFGGGGGGSGVKDQIDTAIDALVKGSRSFQAHHRRPVVLVLDDVDKCARQHRTANPKALHLGGGWTQQRPTECSYGRFTAVSPRSADESCSRSCGCLHNSRPNNC